MTHLADGLKSAAPSLIGVSSEEFVELKPSITTLLVSFRISFRVTAVFIKKNRPKRQKVFPHPTLRVPSASNSPSALFLAHGLDKNYNKHDAI